MKTEYYEEVKLRGDMTRVLRGYVGREVIAGVRTSSGDDVSVSGILSLEGSHNPIFFVCEGEVENRYNPTVINLQKLIGLLAKIKPKIVEKSADGDLTLKFE